MTGNVLERVANGCSDYPSDSVARIRDDRASKNHSAGLRLLRVAP